MKMTALNPVDTVKKTFFGSTPADIIEKDFENIDIQEKETRKLQINQTLSQDKTELNLPTETPYTILEEPNRVGKKIRVIAIGAGASALNFAHDVDTNPLNIDLVLYEKNPEIGGTWFENRYPGCACDIPSVVYQLSWAPSAEWSS
jgi:hypothetical protein